MIDRGTDLYRILLRVTAFAAGLAVFIWIVYRISPVLLASFVALVMALALNAPISWLEARRVPRAGAAVISLLALLALMAGLLWLIVPRLLRELPRLLEQIPELVEEGAAAITEAVGDYPPLVRQLDRAVDWSLQLVENVWGYADQLLGTVVMGIFILALALYLAVNLPSILRWYALSVPPTHRDAAARAFARSSQMVIGWLYASVIFGTIKVALVLPFLLWMGIPGAVVWAILAFFGAFIPRIGFYIMTVPPALVAFTISPMAALWTVVFYVTFAEILGNFVMPQIYAHTMRLSAVFILFMLLAMGYAFGAIGVLIAAPVAGFLKAYYEEFYLALRTDDGRIAERVRAMLARDAGSVRN